MKIRTVRIHNWRSIKDVEICFEQLMVFIGQNNHGKSNILTAILFFFGEINSDELDFCNGCNELYVELVFDDLDESDISTFKKYITNSGTIIVRKVANREEGKCEYHGFVETPQEEWLNGDNASNYTRRTDAESTPLKNYIPSSGRLTRDIIIDAQSQYIEAYRSQLEFSLELESSNFLGTKNVAKGIWGDVFFIPAVKKASDELTTKSSTVFNQLYTKVLNAMSANSEEFINAKSQLKALVKRLNKHTDNGEINNDRPQELTQFEMLLGSELTDWGAQIDVEVTPPDVDNILRIGTTVWVDDGTRTDINRKGQGLQRALIFGLVRALAKFSEQNEAGESVSRRASKSTYFILEEPELFLHPQAQRAVFESLQELSKSSQVIMCTHSSSFISLEWYKSICRVYKPSPDDGTVVYQCVFNNLFESEPDKKRFNMVYWINPDRSELFFAKKVILLEGATDKIVIPLLAKRLGIHRHDYTLIDCGSKDSIPQYIRLLNYFDISYVVAYDKDHQANKGDDAIAVADMSSSMIEGKISFHLGESVIFNNDIEEELGMDAGSRNKPYLALEHVTNSNYRILPSLKTKIETIYADVISKEAY